jgi:hypothetical protein
MAQAALWRSLQKLDRGAQVGFSPWQFFVASAMILFPQRPRVRSERFRNGQFVKESFANPPNDTRGWFRSEWRPPHEGKFCRY